MTLPVAPLATALGAVSFNDFRANPRPNSNTIARQDERQPRAVKLMRVRRATARGSQDISAWKAAGFSPELATDLLRLTRSNIRKRNQNLWNKRQ